MASYTKMTVGKENRTELHEKLALTGAEISLNTLPAGANVPFVHSHKANEEIYGVLSGKGKVVIDGEEISLAAGDWLKISPTWQSVSSLLQAILRSLIFVFRSRRILSKAILQRMP